MQWLSDLIIDYGAWTWLIAGLGLMGLEILAPGFVFLWFGLAAVITGLITFFVSPSIQGQLAVFAVLAVLSLVFWWRVQRRLAPAAADPTLNERASRHIGREFVLAEPIISGNGRVTIDDSMWRISGSDCAAGTKIRISGVDGPTLKVEAVT